MIWDNSSSYRSISSSVLPAPHHHVPQNTPLQYQNESIKPPDHSLVKHHDACDMEMIRYSTINILMIALNRFPFQTVQKKNQRNKLRVTETTLLFNAEKKRTNKIGLKKKMFIQIQQIIHHWNERSKFPGPRWRVRHVWDTCETRAAWHHLPRNRDRVVTSLCPVPRVCSPPPPPPRVIRWVSRRENLRHENTRSCVTCCKSIRLVWSVSKPPRCFTSARVYCSTV